MRSGKRDTGLDVNTRFAQGDIVTTVIKCSGGETITIALDTTFPRSYSRHFTVRGTKGAYFEDTDSFFFDDEHSKDYEFDGTPLRDNFSKYKEEHLHHLWKGYDPKGGHGGMDWLVFEAFINWVREGGRPTIDTYDTASLMCISVLSEESIANGSNSVFIPDFTRGKWCMRNDIKDGKYNLDLIK